MRQVLFVFGTSPWLASHSVWNTSMMKPAASSLAISSPMVLLFSSERRRSGWRTGLASLRTFSLCSAYFLGIPGMSFGDHAKISRFSRRKSTSSTSYLLLRRVPTTTYLLQLGSSGLSLTFLVSLDGWNEASPADSLAEAGTAGVSLASATIRSNWRH